LVSLGLDVKGVSPLLYAALLSLFVGLGAAYYELILTHLAPHVASLHRQALGLTMLALGLLGAIFGPPLLVVDVELWQTGGPIVLFGIALGAVSYALTVVYGRALAIAVAPSLRRDSS
jgi:hypothetical protein